jgi:hypothetical protein
MSLRASCHKIAEGSVELRSGRHLDHLKPHPEPTRRLFHFAQLRLVQAVVRIGEIADDRDGRERLLEELKPLRHQLAVDRDRAGEVVFGPVEMRGRADLACIAYPGEDDRNGGCKLLEGDYGGREPCEDHVGFCGNSFFGVARETHCVAFGEPLHDLRVVAVPPALPQASSQRACKSGNPPGNDRPPQWFCAALPTPDGPCPATPA